MTREYILLVDESKVVESLTFTYPVVLEIIPESKRYVEQEVKCLGGKIIPKQSSAKDGIAISDHGFFLMEAYFDTEKIEDIGKLNQSLLDITGVIDTSLFYNIATKALVVSESGIRIIEK